MVRATELHDPQAVRCREPSVLESEFTQEDEMSNYEYAQATDEQLMDWACADAEARAWEEEMKLMRWAEAGGYKAGLPRPMAS